MRDSQTSSGGFSTGVKASNKCLKYSNYVLLGTNAVLMFFRYVQRCEFFK